MPSYRSKYRPTSLTPRSRSIAQHRLRLIHKENKDKQTDGFQQFEETHLKLQYAPDYTEQEAL